MQESRRKPKRTAAELVAHMKQKGIVFELCSEDEAAEYLRVKNNYFRAASFRKLFPRHREGPNAGRYFGLDFGHLMHLSRVDQELRTIIRNMALDIEHFGKVAILERIAENPEEDGYSIVDDYRASLPAERRGILGNEIALRANDVYCGEMISAYGENMPAWVFLEVASFGTFASFCLFCARRWEDGDLLDDHYMLKKAKSIRNAASHNACIINGFGSIGSKGYQIPMKTARLLSETSIPRKKRARWLANPRMVEISALMSLYSRIVPEGETKDKTRSELKRFFSRSSERLGYLPENNPAVAGLAFIKTLTKAFGLG